LDQPLPQDSIWTPTPKQSEFLQASEQEVLYGGAAGGGKSDALIIDALGAWQNAISQPDYQAVLFRRTYPELKDLIERACEILPQAVPGSKYNQQDHVFRFPSGARLEFGHLQHDQDRFKHRGRAYQYEGWDELTLWPTDVCYSYLTSRLRSTNPKITCLVRATTNPDGPGQKWVKERFAVNDAGDPSCFEVEVEDEITGEKFKRWRRFIPAKLDDNPYLSRTDYRIYLLGLPPEERYALLRGRWDALPVKGAYYAEDIIEAERSGRITEVPHQKGIPVDTWWDLGRGDATSILFSQSVNGIDRFILGYENSGEALEHYAHVLQDQPYIYGTHFIPHDADYERLSVRESDAKSYKAMLEELLPNHNFETIPRIDDVQVGIQLTRNVIGTAFFDKRGCADAIAAFRAYRKVWDDKLQTWKDRPNHDWSSHYADALRQWGQYRALGTSVSRKGAKRKTATSWKHV
jgi:hypothetical protein